MQMAKCVSSSQTFGFLLLNLINHIIYSSWDKTIYLKKEIYSRRAHDANTTC